MVLGALLSYITTVRENNATSGYGYIRDVGPLRGPLAKPIVLPDSPIYVVVFKMKNVTSWPFYVNLIANPINRDNTDISMEHEISVYQK